jgi:hypothetical protein
MSLPSDIRTFVTASTSISAVVGTRMHYNQLPQPSIYPHLWFQRQSREEELDMGGVGGLAMSRFDIEINSTSPSVAISLADKVRGRLHGYRGAMGATTVQMATVADQDDEYFVKSNDADSGIHTAAISLELWHEV